MNNLVRWMGEVGWLAEKKVNVVNVAEVSIQFSEKGTTRMRVFAGIIRPFLGLSKETPPRKMIAEYFKTCPALWSAAPELLAKPLTAGESMALMALVVSYMSNNPGDGGKRF